MPPPNVYQQYLGATFVERYNGAAALTIGDRTYTRYEVAHEIDCPVTQKTMTILSNALRDLGVKTTTQALTINPIDLADMRGVGVTTLYLYLCWQRHAGVNASAAATWYGESVTFGTLKRRVERRKQREREPKRRRRRSVA